MINFKDFKKVGEDKKTTTLLHKDGHAMTILHKGIPSIQREALKRLKLHKGGVAHYDEGTPDAPVSADDEKPTPPVTVNVNTPSAAAQQASAPVQVQQPNVNPGNPAVQLPNGSMSAPGVESTGVQGAQEQEKVDIAKAHAMVPVEQARLQAEQQQAQQDQDRINALQTHADNLANNLQKIDLNGAWHNMSDPKKVTTALGLFLAGLIPFGGTNFAQDTLNKSLDRDVNAQIQNNENQKTIFGAYNTLYNNQLAASKMAKASMADIYIAQAGKIAQQLGTPQAIANYHKVVSDLIPLKNKSIMEASGNLANTENYPSGRKPQQPPQEQPPIDIQKTVVPANEPSNPPLSAENNPPSSNVSFSDLMNNPGKAAAMKESQLGPQKANASEAPSKPEKTPIYKILAPDALRKLHGKVQQGTPAARADYQSVKDQFTQAQQAEKVLNGPKGDGVGGIHDLMQQMYANTGSGNALTGLPGHIRRETEGGLGSVPYVGPALSAATGVIPKSSAQKEYDSNKTVMETDLANALQGLVAPTDINKIVEANLPAYLDSPKDVENKTQKIINMVIKAAKTSQLDQYEMTAK